MTTDLTTYRNGGPLVPDAVIIDAETVTLISENGAVPKPAMVNVVRDAVQRYGIPLTGLNVLGGKLYVNIAGLSYVADHQPQARRIKALTYDWLELPGKENGMIGGVKAHCELWDGSRFENEAWIDPETEKMAAMKTLSNARHKVITKAFARVLRLATGIAITAVEEMGDRLEAPQVGGWVQSVGSAAPDPTKPQPRMGQATAIAAPDPQAALKRFWARAGELGYVNAEGRLKKSAVHAAFNVEAVDGALEQYRQARGATWAEFTEELERITAQRAQAEADTDALPFDPPTHCPQCGNAETVDGECGACGYGPERQQGTLMDAPVERSPRSRGA